MTYPAPINKPFAPAIQSACLVLIVVMFVLFISLASRWYAEQVSLPRYCAQPELVIQRIAEMSSENQRLEDGSRRNYMIAAKLKFIEPRYSDESMEAYLQRLHHRLEEKCR